MAGKQKYPTICIGLMFCGTGYFASLSEVKFSDCIQLYHFCSDMS